ncbi:MAG: YraN family protein [Flavobacteriaceae bacterium]|nr:YraN family protein [Flavobacteriaceae bacterium]
MAKHYDLGITGENLAIDYLLKKGYKIIEKNYRFQKAEVDIIIQKENVLVCIEVKTRSSDYFGDPQDFIDDKKIKLLVKVMNYYVVSKNLDVEVRFDIIAIIKNNIKTEIEHIEDAFLYF